MDLSFIINLKETDPRRWQQATEGLKQIVSRFPVPLMRLEEDERLGCKRLIWKKDVVAVTDMGEVVELKGDYYTQEYGSTFKVYTHLHDQLREMGDEVNYTRRVFLPAAHTGIFQKPAGLLRLRPVS